MAAVTAVTSLLLPGDAAAQSPSGLPLGPLSAEEGAPLQRLGYTPMIEGADPVRAGALRADVWFGYSNIFEQDSTETHNLYLDMERMVTALTVRYGVTGRFEVGARATLETTWGGFLDPVVTTLHNVLSLGNRAREDFPNGSYGQRLEVDGVTRVEVERGDLSLEDVRLFVKWSLHSPPDRGSALSLRAVARFPTRDNLVGDERADVGLMAIGRTRWRRWHLHGMLGASTVRRSPELESVLTDRQLFLMAGVEHPFSDRFSGVIQFTGSTPLLQDIGDRDVDGPLTNTLLGLIWTTEGGWRWEAALQEDTPPWGPSLDFTLQLGVSRVW